MVEETLSMFLRVEMLLPIVHTIRRSIAKNTKERKFKAKEVRSMRSVPVVGFKSSHRASREATTFTAIVRIRVLPSVTVL